MQFVEDLEPQYLCGKCENPLKCPVQVECGHRFCKDCCNGLLDGRQSTQCTAAGCGESFSKDEVNPDKATERFMGNLMVYCPNRPRGCVLPLMLKKLKDHQCGVEDKVMCPFGCAELIAKSEFKDHAQNCRTQQTLVSTATQGGQTLVSTATQGGQYETLPSSLDSGIYRSLDDGHQHNSLEEAHIRIAECMEKLEELKKTTYDGSSVWKVDQYKQKKDEARHCPGGRMRLDSHPFYTSRHGYKMCTRLYLDWGEGGISLAFVIMKGDFDNLHPWPFSQRVSLMLLDQGDSKEHYERAFQPDLSSRNLRKPENTKNEVPEYKVFIPYSKLEAAAPVYVKDDTLFIKVVVETKNLSGV